MKNEMQFERRQFSLKKNERVETSTAALLR